MNKKGRFYKKLTAAVLSALALGSAVGYAADTVQMNLPESVRNAKRACGKKRKSRRNGAVKIRRLKTRLRSVTRLRV